MTRKEIDKFLANTKVYVAGKSKEIQEKLFSLGYIWNNCRTNTVVRHIEAPFLFIYENKEITKSSDMELFFSHENSEITAEEILSLEITEPTYRPFKTKEECWKEMMKHHPFCWITGSIEYHSISSISDVHILLDEKSYFTFEEAFNNFNFADGAPFGIKED